MSDVIQKIQTEGQKIATDNPTVEELQAFVSQSTSIQPIAPMVLEQLDAISPGVAPAVGGSHKDPWIRWEAQIKKAVCDDFKYCSKQAAVKADITQFLPEIIKSLIEQGVGHAGPSWITSILVAFGFTAGWEAAVATVVAYLIIKGLDEWCACS